MAAPILQPPCCGGHVAAHRVKLTFTTLVPPRLTGPIPSHKANNATNQLPGIFIDCRPQHVQSMGRRKPTGGTHVYRLYQQTAGEFSKPPTQCLSLGNLPWGVGVCCKISHSTFGKTFLNCLRSTHCENTPGSTHGGFPLGPPPALRYIPQ